MNNDRFKFRVWFEGRGYCYLNIYADTLGNVYQVDFSDKYEIDGIREQCTGLKDKNGKLIFEGDVVKWGTEKIMTIKWDQGMCSFYAFSKGHGHSLSFHPCQNTPSGNYEHIEIIGNILENPELLVK